jgi:hypothetical protein
MVNAVAVANVSLIMVAAAHRTRVLASATSLAIVLSVPLFAQSNSSSATVAREYIPASHVDAEDSSTPRNFIVATVFRPVVALMLRRSHTFRRQCQRVANAPDLTVALRLAASPMPRGVRARTRIVRSPSRGLSAAIEIPALGDDVELIAHELEHIIEQLDEIDLMTVAKRTNSGVMLSAHDEPVFETRRAIQVGLLVAREVRRSER